MEIKGRILSTKVLVTPHEVNKKTESGLIIPDKAIDGLVSATIVLVGKYKDNEFTELEIGQNVLYDKRNGVAITLHEKEYLLLNKTDIYFIYEDEQY